MQSFTLICCCVGVITSQCHWILCRHIVTTRPFKIFATMHTRVRGSEKGGGVVIVHVVTTELEIEYYDAITWLTISTTTMRTIVKRNVIYRALFLTHCYVYREFNGDSELFPYVTKHIRTRYKLKWNYFLHSRNFVWLQNNVYLKNGSTNYIGKLRTDV